MLKPVFTALLIAAAVSVTQAPQAAASARIPISGPRGDAARRKPQRSPQPWPFHSLQLGLADGPTEAAALKAQAPQVKIRYQYLSGGVNTGQSWQNWYEGGLSYVENYVSVSEQDHLMPAFSYYQLRQSLPGASDGDESQADLTNLADRSTMRAYYADLTAFYKAVRRTTHLPVVLHFEPDAFGYIEAASPNNHASSIRAAVSDTGVRALHGLPNNASGWARAAVRLRNIYAPNVIVAYADSIWGTSKDIHLSHPSVQETAWMASRSAAFYRSLHTDFNMVFTEVTNQDAGEYQADSHSRQMWWDATDYARDLEYIADFHRRVQKPVVIWQIPLGNTVMRAVNDTSYHYQDNHVQHYLGPGSRSYVKKLVNAGVVALLFGSGQQNGTSALPSTPYAIRNPHAIDGNDERSHNDDGDGGYFMARARAYYGSGAIMLR